MFTFTKPFPAQAYLIWVLKLDVLKISMLLSKCTQNTPRSLLATMFPIIPNTHVDLERMKGSVYYCATYQFQTWVDQWAGFPIVGGGGCPLPLPPFHEFFWSPSKQMSPWGTLPQPKNVGPSQEMIPRKKSKYQKLSLIFVFHVQNNIGK